MSSIQDAVRALKRGKFVLIHDGAGRENEIDMVVAAEHITPEHISDMRNHAGGLVCLAISFETARKLNLMYMHDIMQYISSVNPIFSRLIAGRSPYGDKPSFSISINHRDTYTGITDIDRALTILKMSEICKKIGQNPKQIEKFASNFRSPGHTPILIASKGLLHERKGHTELCIYLMQLAGLVPAVTICEMMDSSTHMALTLDKAKEYARKIQAPIIESSQLRTRAEVL